MKKIGISFIILAIISLTVIVGATDSHNDVEYLRIHIRANSNSEEDQSVKYRVKSAVVEYLTPFIAECETKAEAISLLQEKKGELEDIADKALKSNGFSYKSRVVVRKENFPTRVYGDFTLEEGVYDAIIVELGEAKGDNWWCVVYPPLCFTGSKNVNYKSKIQEIINDFRNT